MAQNVSDPEEQAYISHENVLDANEIQYIHLMDSMSDSPAAGDKVVCFCIHPLRSRCFKSANDKQIWGLGERKKSIRDVPTLYTTTR